MTIKSVKEFRGQGMHVDLTGSEGNAFCLLGLARTLAKQLDRDVEDIHKRMTSGDYENLITVFEEEFGDLVTLYR